MIQAGDLNELMGLATAFSWLGKMPQGDRCVFMNVSGGEAGVMADLAEEYGISLADYHPQTKAYLETLVPDYGSVNNPFDMTAGIGYNTPVMVKAMEAISADENVDVICIAYTITPEVWDDTITHMVEAASLARQNPHMKPVLWLPLIEHTRDKESAENLRRAGVPHFAHRALWMRCLEEDSHLCDDEV